VSARPGAGAEAARRRHEWRIGDPSYPIRDAVPHRPALLRGEGARPDAFERPRVAIVGTRAASPHGLADAYELGAFCARHGITVVSGLALGIDGAAHEGALDVGGLAVGVVATGLDVEYPRRHRTLYARVRTSGVVVSEHPDGVHPRPERFPPRNRIIAAIADCVVVVEATASGGARITAGFAADYGREVLALPGSRRNPAAAGCNELIRDGAAVLLDPTDVLVALGRGVEGSGWTTPGAPGAIDPADRRVLAALGGEPASLDQLVVRTGWAPSRLAAALARLKRANCVEERRGRWWPR
jgi:DNA processing protein